MISEQGSPGRLCPDWIDQFVAYASDEHLPPLFTQWSAISAVAACLERRVWTNLQAEPLFPNLYVLFVSTPAGGKSVTINRAADMVRKVGAPRGLGDSERRRVKFGPDDPTKASLIDAIERALCMTVYGDNDTNEQSPIFIAADEFGTAFNLMQTDLMSFLAKMYDAPYTYAEQRRGRSDKPKVLSSPIMNIISGVQPGYLAQNVPQLAWEQGLLARFIMVYAERIGRRHIFNRNSADRTLMMQDKLQRDLESIYELSGSVSFSAEAEAAFESLGVDGIPPIPVHPRLTHYIGRRPIHVAKLATISACSRSNSMIITTDDLMRARNWLIEAEATMPGIFRSMTGMSDDAILQEAYLAVLDEYQKRGSPVPSQFIWQIFSRQAKASQLKYLFQAAIHRGDYLPGDGESFNTIIPARQTDD